MASVTITKAAQLMKKACCINMLSSADDQNITLELESTGGVGKTSIAKQVAAEMGGEAFCIDCTTISDGELNGFPFQSVNEDGEKFVDYSPFYVFAAIRRLEKQLYQKAHNEGFLGGKIHLDEHDDMIVTYVKKTHTEDGKVEEREVQALIKNTTNKYLYTQNNYSWGRELPEELKFELINSGEIPPVIVLFDEVNRASKAVLAETMNILLYHRVQSYILPWWANIVIAVNPGGANAEDYVQKINGAQKSRLLRLQITPAVNEWASYELRHGGDVALVEAIMNMPHSTFDNHVQPEPDPMQTDARAWSFVSKILKYIEKINAFRFFTDEERDAIRTDLNFLCEGKVGEAALAVLAARDNVAMLPKPNELLTGDGTINKAALDKVRAASNIKRYIFVEILVNFLAKEIRNMTTSKKSKAYLDQFAAIYDILDETNKTYLFKCIKLRKTEENYQVTNRTILDIITEDKGVAKRDWQNFLYTTALVNYQTIQRL